MNGESGFLQRLRNGLEDFFHRPIAHHWGIRRWTLLGTTGVLSIAFLALSAISLAAIGSGVGVTVSSNPSFCDSCHEIQPAYDQWKISSHKDVNCVTCHTDEGVAGYQKISFDGLRNIADHLAGDVDLPAGASVKNDSCLACHPRDSLPETMPEATLKIAHSAHEDENCTTCHVRLVHSRLFEQSPAPARAVSQSPKDCSVCHPSPAPTYLHGDAQVACSSCHSGNIPNHDLAVRRNTALQDTCIDCHTQQRVSQPETCQTCHVGPHGLGLNGAEPNCTQCHTSKQNWSISTATHPVALKGSHEQLKCTQCHAALPTPNVQTSGGSSFSCNTCHTPKHTPMDNNCTNCHQVTGWKPIKMKS